MATPEAQANTGVRWIRELHGSWKGASVELNRGCKRENVEEKRDSVSGGDERWREREERKSVMGVRGGVCTTG